VVPFVALTAETFEVAWIESPVGCFLNGDYVMHDDCPRSASVALEASGFESLLPDLLPIGRISALTCVGALVASPLSGFRPMDWAGLELAAAGSVAVALNRPRHRHRPLAVLLIGRCS
jgi:hypothetical protein